MAEVRIQKAAPGTPVTCTVCGHDRWTAGRKLNHIAYDDGTQSKAWATHLEDAQVIVCTHCQTEYVWNAVTLVYDQQPRFETDDLVKGLIGPK